MGELEHVGREIIESPKGVVRDAVERLQAQGTKNYQECLKMLETAGISDDDKAAVRNALFSDLEGQMERGQFEQLDRAKELMGFLGVTEFAFSPEAVSKLTELFGKYSPDFLYRMSPPLYDGKLSDGQPYDEIEYVRNMLKKANGENPSDEEIKELWKYREILVKLHYNRWNPQKQLQSIPKLLAEKR